ncbi:SOUL family heme-binding protein [Acidisphaera rubrifaciens]|uniref:SOUL heme-binding protein n=1 Tax=Acidisphaera rubrifaciens HS-AP3 TaxID=1231350 RepID=A0A0D6PA06_9PROT|nr:heme-binding protein [Acidisphaera rubrifaciens]GAN78171.1 SOUL heme-binding protein [Acidisphaera rubrifaciens HS-AP3]
MLGKIGAMASAVALGACSVFGIRAGTPQPAYRVIAQVGDAEIRAYGPRLAAQTEAEGDTDAARSAAFRRLAAYIFGANHGQSSIAMTAPVATSAAGASIAMTAPVATSAAPTGAPSGAHGLTMTFYMPPGFTAATLPVPNDPRVRIVTVPAQTVAVWRYSGSTSDTHVAAAHAALLSALAGSAWRPVGDVYDWFYDPPWTLPPLRRNEAVVEVTQAPK